MADCGGGPESGNRFLRQNWSRTVPRLEVFVCFFFEKNLRMAAG